MILEIFSSLFLLIFSLFLLIFINKKAISKKILSSSTSSSLPSSTINQQLPKCYPIIGMSLSIFMNKERRVQWTSDILKTSLSSTFSLYRVLGMRQVFTANPSNVKHILKTHFHIYQKGNIVRVPLSDILGNGIFISDGVSWKFQRQVSSHEFNTRSLQKFIETVVDTELSDRLIPVLSEAAANKTVLDLQDILQRFGFDNICQVAFGYDPGYLLPSLPEARFATVFEDAVRLCSDRFNSIFPSIVWRIKKLLSIGSEKQLKAAVSEVREFAKKVVREKKKELKENSTVESMDLLSRFLASGHSDEDFIVDIVISFILAGRDTTSAALTWFFWILSKNARVESEILKETEEKSEKTVYEGVKDMVYTHASLSESMRLYPPVPVDTKMAVDNDILPDGTVVRKGTRVAYHSYAMGRSEEIWGSDWPEFKPERWLKQDPVTGNWSFVARDPYTYPVFQAGPRMCLGKEMAFLQMKRVVAGVLQRFRVVPVVDEEGFEPVLIAHLTIKMKDGFPVRIEERAEKE